MTDRRRVAVLICLKGFAASLRCGNNHAEKSPKDPERTPRGFHRSAALRADGRCGRTDYSSATTFTVTSAEMSVIRPMVMTYSPVALMAPSGVGDGAEQTAVDAALAGDRNFSAVELAGEFFGGSDASSLSLFEFSAASFEFGDSLLRGALGVTLGDQEVAAVAVLDLDDVAQIAEMRDLFKQNDLHFSFLPSITGCPYRAGGPGSGHA